MIKLYIIIKSTLNVILLLIISQKFNHFWFVL